MLRIIPRIIGPITFFQVSPIDQCWVHRRGDTQMKNATRNLASSTKMRKSFATNFGNKLDPLGSWAVARLLRRVWNQLDVLRASCRNSLCSNGSTNCFDRLKISSSVMRACGPRSSICPSHDIFLHCGQRQTCSCGTSRRGWICREYSRSPFSCISSWVNSRRSTRDPLLSSRSGARGVALFLCSSRESKRDQQCAWWTSCSPPFRVARSARNCSRQCRRSSTTDILCTVLWVPHRVVHTIRCFQLL